MTPKNFSPPSHSIFRCHFINSVPLIIEFSKTFVAPTTINLAECTNNLAEFFTYYDNKNL
jgi:hypothetical protein